MADWKFCDRHDWNLHPTMDWADVWLWPVGQTIVGNMGSKINLTVDALGHLMGHHQPDVVELAKRLHVQDRSVWIGPDPAIEWEDGVFMIVRCEALSKSELVAHLRMYLESQGYLVDVLIEATLDEALAESHNEYS
ncbi:MAG: hypothetical protein ACPG8W_24335 [Candidatus Promineifilaceae bacterium]